MTRKERIISNLSQYPNVRKFLGNAIRKRVEIKGYTRGMLTAHLSDGECGDMERLEKVLHLGEAHCTDFKTIFMEMNLPRKDLAIDGEIINTLAEVKAFEVLYKRDFSDIKRIRPGKNKTVDFTATRNGQSYTIEVTRIGIPVSPKKQSEPLQSTNLTDNAGNLLAAIRMYTPDTKKKLITNNDTKNQKEMSNDEIWFYSFESAVKTKYKQLERYISNSNENKRGIVFLSVGRDYFVMGKYTREDMFLRSTLQCICQRLFCELKEKESSSYLHHLIINLGKQDKELYIFPDLNSQETSLDH
ncbi:MAG: hypothetical protein Q7J73_04625 [Dehalococcoidales bacterium]|nr:hypothetical protein [Dehalococcoidales bacterium]